MSLEGTKELLESIDPDYQTSKMDDAKRGIVAESLPKSSSTQRKHWFKHGYNTLKKKKRNKSIFNK